MRRMVLQCKGLLRADVFLTFKYGLNVSSKISDAENSELLPFVFYNTLSI